MAQPTSTKKPGPPLWLGLGTLITGIVLGVIGLVGIIGAVVEVIDELETVEIYDAPTVGAVDVTLNEGEQAIYVRRGDEGLITGISISGPGGSISARQPSSGRNEQISPTVEGGGTIDLQVAALFDVPTDGTYSITVDSSQPTEFAVERSLISLFTDKVWTVILMGIGSLLFVIGAILLIVMGVRRSRARKQLAASGGPAWGQTGATPWNANSNPMNVGPTSMQSPPVAPTQTPAGWYPDPHDAGAQRYWDGNAWTEHTHRP
jgi:hypothetical protein